MKPTSAVPDAKASPTASKLVPTLISTLFTVYPSAANSYFNNSFNGSVAVTIASGSREGTKATFKVSIVFEPFPLDEPVSLDWLEQAASKAAADTPSANFDQKDFFIKYIPLRYVFYKIETLNLNYNHTKYER